MVIYLFLFFVDRMLKRNINKRTLIILLSFIVLHVCVCTLGIFILCCVCVYVYGWKTALVVVFGRLLRHKNYCYEILIVHLLCWWQLTKSWLIRLINKNEQMSVLQLLALQRQKTKQTYKQSIPRSSLFLSHMMINCLSMSKWFRWMNRKTRIFKVFFLIKMLTQLKIFHFNSDRTKVIIFSSWLLWYLDFFFSSAHYRQSFLFSTYLLNHYVIVIRSLFILSWCIDGWWCRRVWILAYYFDEK